MKTALITGASGGIGYEFAKLFAKDKTDIILVARNLKKLEEIKSELEEKYSIAAYCFVKDLSVAGAAAELFDEIAKEKIKVDYLINNAGFGDNGDYIDSDWQKQENMVKLNILSLMELCHLYGKEMRKNKSGKIVNVASMAAFCAGPYMSVYFATKAFVLSFSEALYEELKKYGITVTCLCPGPTETNFADVANSGDSGMFKFLPVATAKAVAEYGYKSMMKGKLYAYHGFLVKSTAVATKLSPRGLTNKIIKLFTKRM